MQQNVVEIVASASIQRKKVKQMLSDSCSVQKRAARNELWQALGYHCRLSGWWGRVEDEVEELLNDVGLIWKR